MRFEIEVNNVPEDVSEYVVARYSTRSLWYWGSWDNEAQAAEVAELIGGVVVRRIKE